MSDKPFTIPVVVTDPDLQSLINDMRTALSEFQEINMRLKRIADLNGLNMAVPSNEEVD